MRRLLVTLLACIVAAPALAEGETPQAIDLPGDRLFPENISIGPDNIAYVSGMSGGVLRVSLATGEVEQWIAPGAYGSGALFGVLADARNGLLWTCTNDFSARGVTVADADAGSWLKAFDLATGEGRISLPLPGEQPVCNDMAVGEDGTLYVTDTANPRILRWKPGVEELEIWKEDAAFGAGLDGLAFGGDGNLYVNNVITGALYRVEMRAGNEPGDITVLTTSRPLSRPDGMRPIGGMAFALAEGGGSISRLDVSGDTVEVTTLAEGIDQPTGVDVTEGTVWYVQGLLSALFNPNAPRPPLPFRLVPVANR